MWFVRYLLHSLALHLGSSLLRSIFGVWKGAGFVGKSGRDMVAAAYAVHGPRTCLVVSRPVSGCSADELTTQEFALNAEGQWVVLRDAITIAASKKVFAPANLRAAQENAAYAALVSQWMTERYTLRYSGGMVPDVHHILAKVCTSLLCRILRSAQFMPLYRDLLEQGAGVCMQSSLPNEAYHWHIALFLCLQGGGVFCNPKSPSSPAKLRVLYETLPLAFVVEAAGGASFDGAGSALDRRLQGHDDRSIVCLGSKEEVAKCTAAMQGG